MPKMRLKAILSRVIFGETWQERNNSDYLLYVRFEHNLSEFAQVHSRTADDDNDNDGNSIISTSTATVNNQPGAGRFIDTHIFQPMGRRFERLAMRFTIASLHPARIAQYIEADDISLTPIYDVTMTLHDAIALLCLRRPNGSTVVAGIKGLVKQTQYAPKASPWKEGTLNLSRSNSIDRSAFALAALIRVSLAQLRREIYINISCIEPVFHLETLTGSLPCSHPDRKWLLLLVGLARGTVVAVKKPLVHEALGLETPVLEKDISQVWPSPETARSSRQRLIQALKAYRLRPRLSFNLLQTKLIFSPGSTVLILLMTR